MRCEKKKLKILKLITFGSSKKKITPALPERLNQSDIAYVHLLEPRAETFTVAKMFRPRVYFFFPLWKLKASNCCVLCVCVSLSLIEQIKNKKGVLMANTGFERESAEVHIVANGDANMVAFGTWVNNKKHSLAFFKP